LLAVADDEPVPGNDTRVRRRQEAGAVAETASFDAFVAARSAALLRSAYLLTGDQQLAEDLVQSVLVKASLRWQRLAAKGDPEPWIRTVLYREHVSWWRRRRFREELAAEPPEPRRSSAGDFVDDLAQAQLLRAALRRLPPRQRAVIVLRHFEDRPEGEVAALLGCSVGTVRSQNARGLASLRRVVPALLAAEEAPR
jgi:RNA polymerase sigma-70 factor (sigma-E family)